jgi:hypothetical protein
VVVDYLHQPEFGFRLLWLLALAIGLPALLAWLCYRGHAEYGAAPSRRRTLGALLLASFVGMTSMAAAWAVAATLTASLGQPRQLNLTFSLANALLGRGLRPATAYMIVYTALLILCVAIGVVFYDVILPIIARRGTSLARQALGLALLCVVLVSCFLLPGLLMSRTGPIDRWVEAGGPLLGLALLAGILCYAFTTACARALAIAVLPSRRKLLPPAPLADTPSLPLRTSQVVDPTGGENKAG